MIDIEELRYPIGQFTPRETYTLEERTAFIDKIEALPARLRLLVSDLSEAQLDTPYRPEGWTVRQVIHHLPDSHMNAVVRFKLALTEDVPTVKPYMEQLWAELPDGKSQLIDVSLDLLTALHRRFDYILRQMSDADFQRTLIHPQRGKTYTLEQVLHNYAWHGEHHYQHIKHLKLRSNW